MIPEWHETNIPPRELVDLEEASLIVDMNYATMRSYSTGRRTHPWWGRLPDPVCRIANRKLWLRRDIELWVQCPLEPWQRSRRNMRRWAEQGRPRTLPAKS